MDSLKNLFTVSDLRNRVLFTLGLALDPALAQQ